MPFSSGLFRHRTASLFLLLCAALGLAGCGSHELTFYDIHGKVTLDGQPVKYAEMHITPLSDQAVRGRTAHIKVVDGQYKSAFGVAAGPAKWNIAVVDIDALGIEDPTNMSAMDDEKFLRAKKKLFEKEIPVDREEINIEL